MLTLVLAAALQTAPVPSPAISAIIDEIPPLVEGETETVSRVRFTVTPEGRAADCTIVKSNAPEALQTEICRIFTEKAKFRPKIEKGVAVATSDEKVIRFRLRGDAPSPAAVTMPQPAGNHPVGR